MFSFAFLTAVFSSPYSVCSMPVSYTHLDVYKRQVYGVTNHGGAPTKAILSALEKTAESEKYAAFGSLDEFFLRQRELYNLSLIHI